MAKKKVRKPGKARFKRFERVVCNIGSREWSEDWGWASGIINEVNAEDQREGFEGGTLPYVVKLDTTEFGSDEAQLISVPIDNLNVCRAEVCFGTLGDAKFSLCFTLFCQPALPVKPRRFKVDERVACAIEGGNGDFSSWAAGTVREVDYDISEEAKEAFPEREWTGNAATIPYRVQLDNGCQVLVHRDEHWLVRDLAIQAEGPRQAPDGTRCTDRIEKRKRGDEWEAVDHLSRKVRRPCPPPLSP